MNSIIQMLDSRQQHNLSCYIKQINQIAQGASIFDVKKSLIHDSFLPARVKGNLYSNNLIFFCNIKSVESNIFCQFREVVLLLENVIITNNVDNLHSTANTVLKLLNENPIFTEIANIEE